jgi:hypothetical protein
MLRFLKNVLAGINQSTKRRAPGRSARLNVEAMEERLVLSTSAAPFPAPALPLALIASSTPHAESTGPTGGTVSTEQAVHGYKWRPRWPRTEGLATSGVVEQMDKPAVTVVDVHSPPNTAAHLIAGGADQTVVTTSADGRMVVHQPEGPLPTEFEAVVRVHT